MQQERFTQLVKERYPLWLRFTAGLVKLPADSPDVACVVQQAIFNVMTRGGGVEGIDEAGANGLVVAAIRNVWFDQGRRQKHHHEYLETATVEALEQHEPADIEATGEELETLRDRLRERFRRAVEQLSPAELTALSAWLETEGVRRKAIELLGLAGDEQGTRNQYDQPLHRAKQRLQQSLSGTYEEASGLGIKPLLDLLREVVQDACVP